MSNSNSSSKCNKLVISWPQNLKQPTDSSATCSTWQQKAGGRPYHTHMQARLCVSAGMEIGIGIVAGIGFG